MAGVTLSQKRVMQQHEDGGGPCSSICFYLSIVTEVTNLSFSQELRAVLFLYSLSEMRC
jgi:hypothetical protein